MNKEKIALICDKVRKKYNIIVPIHDGYELAYQANGHVRESSMAKNIRGQIRSYKDSFWITLNKNLSEQDKKITIAQLMGVFYINTNFLENDNFLVGLEEENIKITEKMLKEAEIFVKELLLPKHVFIPYFCNNITFLGKINLRILADYFDLPLNIIEKRAMELQLITTCKKIETIEES